MTRWHGTMTAREFAAQAPPTSRADFGRLRFHSSGFRVSVEGFIIVSFQNRSSLSSPQQHNRLPLPVLAIFGRQIKIFDPGVPTAPPLQLHVRKRRDSCSEFEYNPCMM